MFSHGYLQLSWHHIIAGRPLHIFSRCWTMRKWRKPKSTILAQIWLPVSKNAKIVRRLHWNGIEWITFVQVSEGCLCIYSFPLVKSLRTLTDHSQCISKYMISSMLPLATNWYRSSVNKDLYTRIAEAVFYYNIVIVQVWGWEEDIHPFSSMFHAHRSM